MGPARCKGRQRFTKASGLPVGLPAIAGTVSPKFDPCARARFAYNDIHAP